MFVCASFFCSLTFNHIELQFIYIVYTEDFQLTKIQFILFFRIANETNFNILSTRIGSSYHHNRRSGRHERERERIDRERERIHARERELSYEINDDDLVNERNYNAMEYGGRGVHLAAATTHIRHTNDDSDILRDRDGRYPMSNQPNFQSNRRERDEFSPHRGGGNNRRALNAM